MFPSGRHLADVASRQLRLLAAQGSAKTDARLAIDDMQNEWLNCEVEDAVDGLQKMMDSDTLKRFVGTVKTASDSVAHLVDIVDEGLQQDEVEEVKLRFVDILDDIAVTMVAVFASVVVPALQDAASSTDVFDIFTWSKSETACAFVQIVDMLLQHAQSKQIRSRGWNTLECIWPMATFLIKALPEAKRMFNRTRRR